MDFDHESDPLDDPDFREKWPGWATVESEPAVFHGLLQQIGVRGMTVREIYSLDAESVLYDAVVYGLVFLFRWKEDYDVADSPSQADLEENIWFANQVVENACATLALLNIVCNVDDAILGPELSDFKAFTKDFTSALRGLAITNATHLRVAHNTFARKSEMAKCDLALLKAVKNAQSKSRTINVDEAEEESAPFHFVAYIHKHGHLWELDGLKQFPVRLDECARESWTIMAIPRLQAKMDRYTAGELRFNLLAVCQDTEHVSKQPDLPVEGKEEIRSVHVVEPPHDYSPFIQRMLELLNDKGIIQSMAT